MRISAPVTGTFRRAPARRTIREMLADMRPIAGGAGEEFVAGESKTRPGVYARITTADVQPGAGVTRGVVGAVVRGDWGPLGAVTEMESEGHALQTFGDGATALSLREVFRGGARKVLAVRAGTGGGKAAFTEALKITLTAKHEGVRGNDFRLTHRTNLGDATKSDLLVYDGTTLLETITYTPGANGAQALTDAVNASSNYLDATYLGTGDVTNVTNQALTAGTDPTVDGAAYTAALDLLETESFNVLAVDTEDTSIHAAVEAWVDNARAGGLRAIAVLAEPTSVAFATRTANAAAFNNPAVVYVANGFSTEYGDIDGFEAAFRVAGLIAGAALTESLTHKVVTGATDIVGPLTATEIESAITNGALVFSRNARREVQVEYGITTLVTPGGNLDAGWSKIRRVRTRDELMTRVAQATDALVGRVNNDANGRAQIRAAIQGEVNTLIAEGALGAGTVTEDPANPATGDSAYFVISVDDNDSAEKVYLTFGFRFTPAAA